MSRIFGSLSITSLLLILLAMTYGLLNGDYNRIVRQLKQTQLDGVRMPDDAVSSSPVDSAQTAPPGGVPPGMDSQLVAELRRVQWHARNHMLLGVFASVMTALVQCVGVTYFIGTSRWFKEVVDAYALDVGIVAESSRIKRSSFPFAMLGIATIVCVAAFGAAADPGTLRENTGQWVAPHYTAAIIGLCLIAFALYRQARAIQRNQELIDRVMRCVHDARVARHLEV